MTALARLQDSIGFESLQYDDSVGKVSIVGAGMKSSPGVTALMFETLAEHKINIEMISTSEIRITTIIAEDRVEQAVRALHAAFSLEQPEAVEAAAHAEAAAALLQVEVEPT